MKMGPARSLFYFNSLPEIIEKFDLLKGPARRSTPGSQK
jgi:hypothetical protein